MIPARGRRDPTVNETVPLCGPLVELLESGDRAPRFYRRLAGHALATLRDGRDLSDEVIPCRELRRRALSRLAVAMLGSDGTDQGFQVFFHLFHPNVGRLDILSDYPGGHC